MSAKFEEFWKGVHPAHKVAKKECLGIWKRMKLDPLADKIIEAYRNQLTWPCFAGDRVQYLKRPPSWLRGERWEDERPPDKRPAGGWRPKELRGQS